LVILRAKRAFRIKSGNQRGLHFELRFPRGTVRGCLRALIGPTPGGGHRWIGGPGAVTSASPAVRRYLDLSLRFTGVMKAGDVRHVRGGFVSDLPTGYPC
jgi:hypothetical protein